MLILLVRSLGYSRARKAARASIGWHDRAIGKRIRELREAGLLPFGKRGESG